MKILKGIVLPFVLLLFVTCTFLKTLSPGEFEDEKQDFELKNSSILTNLEITGVTINPAFASDTTTYNATVASSLTTVKVTPTAEYSNATIKINGSTVKSGNQSDDISLNIGISAINIEVTSYDKKKKTNYNVNITRATVLLSGLSSSSGSLSPSFNPQTFNYSITVDYNIKTIALTPSVSDNAIIIEVNDDVTLNNSQSDPVTLNYGINLITVKIKYPQDAVYTVYYVSVTRNPIKLSSLTVSAGSFSPSFDANTYNYTMTVDYFVKNILFTPTVIDSNIIIDINGNITVSGSQSNPINLSYGSNSIAIKLKYAEDTVETVYNLTITRKQIVLSSLSPSSGILEPSLNNLIFNYNIETGYNIANIQLTPVTTDDSVIIKINNLEVQSGYQSLPINLVFGNNSTIIELKYLEDITSIIYNINIKVTNEDTLNWNKKIDTGLNGYNYAKDIAIDSDNNVYIAGNGTNLVNSSSRYDWWIKKFNSNGVEDNVNWNKKYSNSNISNTVESANSIAIDSNNKIYVAGNGYNLVNSSSGHDWWIKKFDSNGAEDTVNWDKKIDSGPNTYDFCYFIAVDSFNNVYVAGYGSNLVNSSSQFDWWIKKFDSNGIEDTVNWNKKIDGGFNNSDCCYSIAIDSNNNIYFAGTGFNLITSKSGHDWWIKKFDSNGIEDTANWNKKFSFTDSSGIEHPCSITVDLNNNIYVSGIGTNLVGTNTGGDWLIKKFDSNGNEDIVYWNKKFSSYNGDYYERAYSIVVDSNNNVYVAGYGVFLISSSSYYDWWIKKFDSNGNENLIDWDKKFSGANSEDEYVRSLAIDSNNNIYAAGIGYNLVSSSSGYDWWIKKFINP